MRIQMTEQNVTDTATTAKLSEVAPYVPPSGSYIVAQEGENTTTTIIVKTRTFVVIHVGLTHRYTREQQWYYFERKPDGKIRRLTASQLSPQRRNQVLDAYWAGKSPDWAKQPFVEKPATPGKPERKIRYKAVAVLPDETFCSIYDDSVEYVLGKTYRQKGQPDHNGGYYVYRSAEKARDAAVPNNSDNRNLPRAVLKCKVWGRCELYGETEWDGDTETPTENTKEAWTYLKPLEVVL